MKTNSLQPRTVENKTLMLAIIAALSINACSTQIPQESRQSDGKNQTEIALEPAPKTSNQIGNTTKEDDAELETIMVTGSRIKRVDADTANEVLVLDRAQIEESGNYDALASKENTAVPSPPAPPAPPASPFRKNQLTQGTTVAAATSPVLYAAPVEKKETIGIPIQNTENYQTKADNALVITAEVPVSTFSIDVDTGSYSNVRRMINQGQLPPRDAVRAEEFINYFDYAYAPPNSSKNPFSVTTEIAPAPWNQDRKLLMVGIKGYEVTTNNVPASNVVFLIDTSGSMESPDKIELLKAAFKQMVPKLREQDRVSIVVYAGSAGLVLPPTSGAEKSTIVAALDGLSAGGSTNGGQGIQLAYAMAKQGMIKNGVNRVILASDGDFNVGTVNLEALKTMVANERESGIALTTLGFGQGNYNDELAEQLADIGNGNHFYIDTLNEAHKVLCEELSATMMTIAKDVKIQIEFNPTLVSEYRLIGYENRMLRREDFNNDKIDAGEIGAGHDVTALYELTLTDSKSKSVDPLRYNNNPSVTAFNNNELAFLKLRYKQPNATKSILIEKPLLRTQIAKTAGTRMKMAAGVAAFADQLRGGNHMDGFGLAQIKALIQSSDMRDPFGYRAELVSLIDKTRAIKGEQSNDQVAISQ